MILLIDNYDSFSYNLYQLAGSLYPDIRVIRNDAYTLEEIEAMHPEGLLLSPGPGRPEDAGVTVPSIPYFAGKLPILGVCLGHQAICQAFGAPSPMRKSSSTAKPMTSSSIRKVPSFPACRASSRPPVTIPSPPIPRPSRTA